MSRNIVCQAVTRNRLAFVLKGSSCSVLFFFTLVFHVCRLSFAQQTNAPAKPDTARLPAVTVTATPLTLAPDQLREEAPVGAYGQPEWTTARRFPTTRVYLQKNPWEVGVEQWWRSDFLRNGTLQNLFLEEVEIGLPHRMQFDLYEAWGSHEGNEKGRMKHDYVSTELRWAPADWGKIPLNPTLYGEWKFRDRARGPDTYELKLLLGEEIAPRWHWGFNAIYEQDVGGARTTEMAFSQGLSYTLEDQKLSVGVEMKFSHETVSGARSKPAIEFLIGPSLQWRPTSYMHLDMVPLLGVTADAPRVQSFIVLSFDFGPFGSNEKGRPPTSLRGN